MGAVELHFGCAALVRGGGCLAKVYKSNGMSGSSELLLSSSTTQALTDEPKHAADSYIAAACKILKPQPRYTPIKPEVSNTWLSRRG